MTEIIKKLNKIQSQLKAPKNQRNNFGGYNYRSCEDIMEAVKPLLEETGTVLTVSDDIVCVGNRIYVKATATLMDETGDHIENSAFAREAETKKGMDDSQITGAASSYARKYALNGLFCIDDTKDADATNTHGKETAKKEEPKQSEILLNRARELYKYCSGALSITLQDPKRFEIESTINGLKAYKRADLTKAADDLEKIFNQKAEQDTIVY